MQDFDYVKPSRLDEAISLLVEYGSQASILSGGTDLLVQLREGRRSARLVVDIKEMPETNELSYNPQSGLRIGAAVPCCRIYGDKTIVQHYPGLIDVASLIGGTQIQGRASLGGNLCNASPAADSIPALIVHRARCVIVGPTGQRTLPVEEFCTGPGQTNLRAGELLLRFEIPPPPNRFGARYLRFIPRHEMDIAVVGVGAAVILDDTHASIVSARLALGAVAPTPLLVESVSVALENRRISEEVFGEAAHLAQEAARPITDMRGTAAQRISLVGVLTRRAFQAAVSRAISASGELVK